MYKINFSSLYFCVCTIAVVAGVNLKAHRAHVPHRNPDGRIIGGHEAEPHSVPYAVALIINGNAFCGGSLISPNYVLTAAHCGTVVFSLEVILGAHDHAKHEPTQQRYYENLTVIVHEHYNRITFENNIALIRLPYPAVLNDYVGTVKLPSRSDSNNDYFQQRAKLFGWGMTYDKNNSDIDGMSKVLMYVGSKIIDNEECSEYFNDPGLNYVNEGTLCASGKRSRGVCDGDSGGLVMIDDVQIGLTSFVSDLCENCIPSVFTSIGRYLDWIAKHSDVKIK